MIVLAYFTKDDFQQLIDWVQDEELLMNWAGTQFRFPLNHDKLNWYIEDANNFEKSSTLIYKAIDSNTGKTVGHISLSVINRRNRSARITRALVGNTAERGKGIGEGMMKAMLKIGFEELNLHRMSLGVYDFNEPAIKCYKKCGFHVDGVLRDIQKHKDQYWNLMEMSMLENEYVNMPYIHQMQREQTL
jgi:RimJ/RimL family protein N-acetyltransferase